jgi:hypothetical protein
MACRLQFGQSSDSIAPLATFQPEIVTELDPKGEADRGDQAIRNRLCFCRASSQSVSDCAPVVLSFRLSAYLIPESAIRWLCRKSQFRVCIFLPIGPFLNFVGRLFAFLRWLVRESLGLHEPPRCRRADSTTQSIQFPASSHAKRKYNRRIRSCADSQEVEVARRKKGTSSGQPHN